MGGGGGTCPVNSAERILRKRNAGAGWRWSLGSRIWGEEGSGWRGNASLSPPHPAQPLQVLADKKTLIGGFIFLLPSSVGLGGVTKKAYQ